MFLRPHNTVSSNAVINSSELFSIKVWTGMELESNWYGTGMELVCCVGETGWVFAPCLGDALLGRLKVTITKPPSHLVGGVWFFALLGSGGEFLQWSCRDDIFYDRYSPNDIHNEKSYNKLMEYLLAHTAIAYT